MHFAFPLELSDIDTHLDLLSPDKYTNTPSTLSTKDSVNIAKQLTEEFKRSGYWNSYQTTPAIIIEKGKHLYKLLNASFQGIRRLFFLAYVVAAGAANNEASIKDNRNYFLARGKIDNYNVLIDGRNFYDQPINDLIKHSMMKSEKHQRDKVMIALQDFCQIISKIIKQTTT